LLVYGIIAIGGGGMVLPKAKAKHPSFQAALATSE
jgi:hypothetical protein